MTQQAGLKLSDIQSRKAVKGKKEGKNEGPDRTLIGGVTTNSHSPIPGGRRGRGL